MIQKKRVNKLLRSGFVGMFFLMFMSSFVLGALEDESEYVAREGAGAVVGFIRGIGEVMSDPLFGSGELLSRFFLAILLAAVVYSIMSTMFEKGWISVVMTLAITSLAMVGIPGAFLEAIRVQYGVMGATILTIIPFLIILVFSLRTRSLLMARVTWIVWFGYYFTMYIYAIAVSGTLFTGGNAPYIGAIIVGLFMLIAIPFFRKLVFKGEVDNIKETGVHYIEKKKLLRELSEKELDEVYG